MDRIAEKAYAVPSAADDGRVNGHLLNMDILDSCSAMRQRAAELAGRGVRIGLVPTMGSFHAGHLRLMEVAGQQSELVVVSLFVNPAQFGPGEDFERYPRDFERDRTLAESAGANILFLPRAEEMYLPGHSTWVEVGEIGQELCGASRPGHFRGVATVVAKLFHLCRPFLAVFGEKDRQQLAVIRRMVKDLDFGIGIVGVPTVREADGLAMSSRNAFLNPEERRRAPAVYQGLLRAEAQVKSGEERSERLETDYRLYLEKTAPGARIDYVRVVHPERISPVEDLSEGGVMAVAVYVGNTRLIDNILLRPAPETESGPRSTDNRPDMGGESVATPRRDGSKETQ